jgi:hypothetical protein
MSATTTDEPAMKRYLLVWLDSDGSIDPATIIEIRRAIEDAVLGPPEQVEIDVWLESPGGDAHAAYKLALMLRNAAHHIRVVIPDYAKSAATLLTLVGHEIFMASGAELGPLDAQVPDEGSLIGAISALNIARAADEVARDAVDLAIAGSFKAVRELRLGRADTLDAMLEFSANFSEPLVRQLDPRIVHQAKELLRVTVQYAERLLRETTGRRARTIATRLVEDFPTHGFVISINEADALGLPVRPIEEYDLLDLVREHHRAAEEGDTCVLFTSLEEFLGSTDETEDETQPEDESDDQGHDEAKQLQASVDTNGHEVSAEVSTA